MTTDRVMYIDALKFASERDTFTIQQLFDHLQPSDDQKHRLAVQVSNKEIFFHARVNYFQEYQKGKDINLSMSVEDEFRLLEYTELSEARASSRQATLFCNSGSNRFSSSYAFFNLVFIPCVKIRDKLPI